MKRYPNWPRQLQQTLQAAREAAFLWGESDCCLFAADCCVAICGVDPAAEYRGRYQTAVGAKRVLANTHGSLEAAWDACFERVPVAQAMRGDVVLFEAPLGRCVGVVWSGGIWCVTEEGAARAKAEPLIAWRVEARDEQNEE
jgi:hypothetical protein